MIHKRRTPLCILLALLLAGAGHFIACSPPNFFGDTPDPSAARPVITVEATYPGANAEVVFETISAPIEQQVNGVEKMKHMWSRSTNDGKYNLNVILEPGVDLDLAQVLVQNRVALALPVLPDTVKSHGITTKKGLGGALMVLSLTSPDGSRDGFFLSDYSVALRNELAILPGVGEVVSLGTRDRRTVRLLLDTEKMAARKLTAVDIVTAIKQQSNPGGEANTQSPARKQLEGRIASESRNRPDIGQFGNIILKTTADGRSDRLKDVARIERGGYPRRTSATLNGKPAVVQVISPAWQARLPELSTALHEKLSQLRAKLPKGIRLNVAFEFTPSRDAAGRPECLLIAPVLPASASPERIHEILTTLESRLRGAETVKDALILPENPFDCFHNQACMLVRLSATDTTTARREDVIDDIRSRLAHGNEAAVRIQDLSAPGHFPPCGYPVEMAIYSTEEDQTKLKELAEKLAERLRKSKKLTERLGQFSFLAVSGVAHRHGPHIDGEARRIAR